MANYTRKDAFGSGGDFTNPDLLWYARGVAKMMERKLDDPTSWWFFAAIHGEYVNPKTSWYVNPPSFPDWNYINTAPVVPTSPLPTQGTQDLYWNQCQHGSWYFLPWHRGYLLALEAQLRADIASIPGGPQDWSLPYWDYFGGPNGSQAAIPPAFTTPKLPDGTPNALYVTRRYGPTGDKNIYIPTPAWNAAHPAAPGAEYGDVTNACYGNDLYTGSDLRTKLPGFGGPKTEFAHSGAGHGNIEANPHDLVHVYTGGGLSDTDFGLMSDPGTAALDPIFYLHHCNIDRMWASWNAAGNSNPTSADWLNGPTQHFVMPWPNAGPWYYTPMQVANLADLAYAYETLDVIPSGGHPLALRLERLGAPDAAERVRRGLAMVRLPTTPELLGASTTSILVEGKGAHAITVRLDAGVRRKVSASLAAASEVVWPDRAYLKLENVRGVHDATVLGVFINLGDSAESAQRRASLAGQVALFGLRRASATDGQHGGSGLTFIIDITRFVDDMAMNHSFDVGSIQVSLLPQRPLPANATISVGRISLYREGQ